MDTPPVSPEATAIEIMKDPAEDGGDSLIVNPAYEYRTRKRFRRLQSLTRLIVGGIEIGLEQFWRRLEEWEENLDTGAPEQPAPAQTISLQPAERPGNRTAEPRTARQSARLATVGMIFQTEDHLRFRGAQMGRMINLVGKRVGPLLEPINRLPLVQPARRNFNNLVARGELEIASWIKTGEEEEFQSHALARMALNDTTDDYIDYLATHPSVQELVETQSTGLATEVVEEMRERTVSADTFLEGIARAVLRKVPRALLPEPPPEVRMKATSFRPPPEKVNKKP